MTRILEPTSQTQPTSHTWQRRKYARPGEILKAAWDSFREHGYAGTSMADIAHLAGITKGTIYLYYQNKEDLFKALAREYIAEPLAAIVVPQETERSELAVVDILNQAGLILFSPEVRALSRIVYAEAYQFPFLSAFWHQEVLQPLGERLAALLAGQSGLNVLPPEAAAWLCLAPIMQGMQWQDGADNAPGFHPSHHYPDFCRTILYGLGHAV